MPKSKTKVKAKKKVVLRVHDSEADKDSDRGARKRARSTPNHIEQMTAKLVGTLTPAEKAVLDKRRADLEAEQSAEKSAAALVLRPTLDSTSLALMTPVDNIAAQVIQLKIIDPLSNQRAVDMLLQLKQMRDSIETRRVEIIRPLQEGVKRVQALFKPTLTKLETADEDLRRKVVEYRRVEGDRAMAERERLTKQAQAAAAKGNEAKATELATRAVNTVALAKRMDAADGSTDGVSVRKVVDFEVVDLGAIPREYMQLNETAVRAALRAKVTEISGLRIFERDSLAVGSVR